jgi:cysteine desulfurase
MKRLYLDWNAAAPLDPRVLDRMLPYLREHAGNPSSLHEPGRTARRAIEDARESVAAAIGAEAREIVFTSGATEANNLAITGLAADRPGALVETQIEHPSVREASTARVERAGAGSTVSLAVGPDGAVDVRDVEEVLASKPALLAVMAVNNETGVIQPIDRIADLCARAGVPLHVDAVQALGKLPFSVAHQGIASASFSAHKIGGPKGAGALFVRSGVRLEHELVGGGQERGRRAGTENVPGIVGLGAAAALAAEEAPSRRGRLADLESRLLGELRAREIRFAVHAERPSTGRVPGTLNLRFPGFSGEGMLFGLDLLGVSVSLGSACSSGAAKPSHVLAAMGVPLAENLESVRFSLGWTLAEADMATAAAAIATVLERGRRGPS